MKDTLYSLQPILHWLKKEKVDEIVQNTFLNPIFLSLCWRDLFNLFTPYRILFILGKAFYMRLKMQFVARKVIKLARTASYNPYISALSGQNSISPFSYCKLISFARYRILFILGKVFYMSLKNANRSKKNNQISKNCILIPYYLSSKWMEFHFFFFLM